MLVRRAAGISSTKDTNSAIDAEYLSELQLNEVGLELAGARSADLANFAPFSFQDRQRQNLDVISGSYKATYSAAEAGQLITPAAEWLLDNFYRVEDTARQLKRDLPRAFYRSLPTVRVTGGAEVPRVLTLAWTYVAHSRSEVTRERLSALIDGFQHGTPLRIGELWAVPSMLRFVLLEDLARIARRIDRARLLRDLANDLADVLLSTGSADKRLSLLQANEINARDNTFASQLLYRLSEEAVRAREAIAWIETHLEARGSSEDEVQIAEQNRLSAGNVRIGNIVRGLQAIDDIDWKDWFASVSRVDAVLGAGSNFDALDFTSQDQYRGAVEEMARWSGKSEPAVAERAIDRSAGAGADVGSTLAGRARAGLEADLGCRLPILVRLARAYRGLGWLGIAAPVLALTVFSLAVLLFALTSAGAGTGTALVLTFLAALPASQMATAIFNTFVTATVRPSRLVGYEFKNGVPDESRTLVVMPCLIDSFDTIDQLVRTLEVHYLSHTRGELYFALLSDWADFEVERDERDEALLVYARAEIARLAKLYAHDGRTRFFLLHRARLYSAGEGVWMGWERKRGKLLELGAVLRGEGEDTTFLPLEVPLPDGIIYVMTLDADTRLTRDAVTKLVGKLAHPLNHPEIDLAAGRVVDGYGILQPRVTPSLTTGAEASTFQRVFSANRGLDPYVFAVSDVYQDLTGQGSFTGKGLFHVDTFHALLAELIPENAVLSHDLLEGIIVRAALVTDVEVVEDFPVRYEVEASRQHRWARGDWQLLPLLFARGVDALGRWKMLDNLRRTLVPVAWVAASILGWCLLSSGVGIFWQFALIFTLACGPVLSLLRQLWPRGRDGVVAAEVVSWLGDAANALGQVALQLAFMAQGAASMADAVVRTLYRLFVSRRHLLQWRSAALVASRASSPQGYVRGMLPSIAIGVVGLGLALLAGGGVGIAAVFAVLWIAAPGIAWLVSRTAETEDRLRVTPDDRDALRRAARRSWAYYAHFVTQEHHWLPPDNFQETPQPVVASRTSPTNIGCYLLSVLSARDFGWIGLAETVSRLEDTVATVETLPKYRGHLFNWYETRSAKVLTPAYVSTVDSGNLAGHLVCLSSACRDWAAAPFAHVQIGFSGIGDVAGVLAEELAGIPDERRALRPLRRRIEEQLSGFDRLLQASDNLAESRLSPPDQAFDDREPAGDPCARARSGISRPTRPDRWCAGR